MLFSLQEDTTVEQEDIERIFLGFAVEAQKQMTGEIYLPKKKVIVLAGPTGAGKTELSKILAKELNGEIISADSMQVYRGMDIGTDKVSPEERLDIPHHMIDIREISESFNVVDFYYEARQCCKMIQERGGVPIVVGGSGFYLHSFIYGPPSGPPSVPQLRKQIEDELEKKGAEALFEKLRKLDPQYASTITKHDRQKIVRALEIITLSGEPVSRHSWKGQKEPQTFDFRCWFLYRPKDLLYKRIEMRCDEMIKKGFLEEVKELDKKGIRKNSSCAQSIGYRQALDYLESKKTAEDHDKFVSEFKKVSRRLAKRQFTWFRKEPLFRWLDLDLFEPEVAVDMIRQQFETC